MASYDDTATVSGSIVRVNDGADSVGLKNWLVTLPASLDGYSEVNGTKSGKNLFDKTNTSGIVTGYIDTTSFKTGTQNAKTVYIPIKGGETYTVSKTAGLRFAIATSENIPTNGALYTSRKVNNTASSLYITAGANDKYLWAWVFLDGTDTGTLADMLASVQIEVGSTATSYEAYEAPTQYTASLGRTIYGGQADIVSGQGIEEREKVEFDGSDDENWSLVATGTYRYSFMSLNFIKTNTMYTDILCDTIEVKNTSENVDGGITCRGTNYSSRRFYIFFPISNSEGVNDLTTFKAWLSNNPCNIVYAPTTPTDFTFTPVSIETSKGSNTFWSEQGDSEVTYYKDGYGFTSVTIHKETPDGEPVEQTAKLHRIVYGGLVDVISGKAEPKNILLSSNTDSASTVVNGVTRSYSLDSQTWTLEGTNTKTDANWLIYNGANYVLSKALVVGDTYTYSHTLSANCYSQFTYKDTNGATRALGYLVGNANKNASVTFTVPSNFVELLRFQIGVVKTATSVSEEAVFQLEKASSKTEYAPYFDPFTFTPISMETDEGENTLYADEGDSAITYRKAVD